MGKVLSNISPTTTGKNFYWGFFDRRNAEEISTKMKANYLKGVSNITTRLMMKTRLIMVAWWTSVGILSKIEKLLVCSFLLPKKHISKWSENLNLISPTSFVSGERTFDNLFFYDANKEIERNNDASTSLTNQETDRAAMLNESIVSQHFSGGDQSNLTFEGSVKFSLFSFFACRRGSCWRVRGRNRKVMEARRLAKTTRERFAGWLNELRSRF